MIDKKTALVVSASKESNLGDQLIHQALSKYLYSLKIKTTTLNYRLQYYKQSNSQSTSTRRQNHYFLKRITAIYILAQCLYFLINLHYYICLIRKKLVEVDIVIIGGGQLIMDSPKSILNPLNLLLITVIASLCKKKIIYAGIGISKENYFQISEYIFSYCLKQADRILCRDQLSLQRAISLVQNSNTSELSFDLAILDNAYDDFHIPKDVSRKIIGISTLAYFDPRYFPNPNVEKFKNYKKWIRSLIIDLEGLDFEILILPTAGPDVDVALEIDPNLTYVSKDCNELIARISSCDYFIATRMHSFIAATCLGKKSLVLNWDKKVIGFCESIYGFSSDKLTFSFDTSLDGEKLMHKLNAVNNVKIINQLQSNRAILKNQLRHYAS